MRLSRLALTCLLVVAPSLAHAAPFSTLYVFGDSLSDTGNLSGLAASTLGLAIPVSPYAPGRASNGPVAVEVLAGQLGLSAAPVVAGGTNYAVIGAATGDVPTGVVPALADNIAEVLLGAQLPVDTGLVSQVGGFLALTSAPLDPAALFFVWAGANDFFINGADPSTAVTAVARIAGSVQALYAAGARQFLVPNLPDLSLTPGGAPGLQAPTVAFNTLLAQQLALLSGLPGMNLVAFDTFALFNTIVADPASAGFTNVSDACATGNVLFVVSTCTPNEDEYLFWDAQHPTARAHALLGEAFADAVQGEQPVPEPLSLVLGGVGLGFAVLRRRKAA